LINAVFLLIKNLKKFFIAAHRAAAPAARRKSMDDITGSFAAGAAYAAPKTTKLFYQ